ncbi:zinc-responsive transcriptional regulator [Oxobacter pfennigii]|uniref:Zinc-responsive transcriptional regulator n=1 Tax=Oxobacter pfennigii TaxID=36849 RepID=A0A0P8W9I0_9CLOT|nr:MerR family transcriptional regulator [Oxobacter pfennigii]KPU44342.1 zinc-responsive transcriptional regulator [Oxobacter pfennigii]
MGYKIGDVSKLLNMPVETIRYYETKNIIRPYRLENSKYRVYETWDIFYLMQCMKYKSFNLSLEEIAQVINNGSLQYILDKINEKDLEIREKISHDTLLAEKLEELIKKLETITLNQGNYWIQKLPERYYLYCVESDGDSYNDFDLSNPLFSQWLQYYPFVTACKHTSIHDFYNYLNREKWSLTIEKKYAEIFKLAINEYVKILPEQVYITTIVNAGEKGELSVQLLEPAISYTESKGYKISGDILGELLVRTHESGKYHRFFELMIPIQK